MDKRMVEEWAIVVEVVTRLVSAVSLAVLAGVFVMMWKGGSLSLGTGSQGAAVAPSAQAPAAAPDQAVTQLADDQWKQVLDNAVNKEGKGSAKVTMVEFTDFQCPFCEQYFTNTYNQIKKDYIDTGKVQYMIENFPLPFHPNAHVGAEAAACAGDQNKFWEMHDKLFSNQNDWVNDSDPKPKYYTYAGQINLNVDAFKKCLADGKFKTKIDGDVALGTKMGVSGTPSFFVNGKLIVGAQPYSQFKTEIDAALAK